MGEAPRKLRVLLIDDDISWTCFDLKAHHGLFNHLNLNKNNEGSRFPAVHTGQLDFEDIGNRFEIKVLSKPTQIIKYLLYARKLIKYLGANDVKELLFIPDIIVFDYSLLDHKEIHLNYEKRAYLTNSDTDYNDYLTHFCLIKHIERGLIERHFEDLLNKVNSEVGQDSLKRVTSIYRATEMVRSDFGKENIDNLGLYAATVISYLYSTFPHILLPLTGKDTHLLEGDEAHIVELLSLKQTPEEFFILKSQLSGDWDKILRVAARAFRRELMRLAEVGNLQVIMSKDGSDCGYETTVDYSIPEELLFYDWRRKYDKSSKESYQEERMSWYTGLTYQSSRLAGQASNELFRGYLSESFELRNELSMLFDRAKTEEVVPISEEMADRFFNNNTIKDNTRIDGRVCLSANSSVKIEKGYVDIRDYEKKLLEPQLILTCIFTLAKFAWLQWKLNEFLKIDNEIDSNIKDLYILNTSDLIRMLFPIPKGSIVVTKDEQQGKLIVIRNGEKFEDTSRHAVERISGYTPSKYLALFNQNQKDDIKIDDIYIRVLAIEMLSLGVPLDYTCKLLGKQNWSEWLKISSVGKGSKNCTAEIKAAKLTKVLSPNHFDKRFELLSYLKARL